MGIIAVKHQIKHRDTGAVLFEREVPADIESGLRTRHALEQAVAARANLSSADLSGAYLRGADLRGANLSSAYLSSADLSGANLSGANLSSADLSGADLRGAYLRGANLSSADLSGANLSGANLSSADLNGANLSGAKWRDGITIHRAPLQIAGLHWPVYILDHHMQIGCELHSFAQWASFDDARIVKMSGKDALRFWRAHKDALLAMAASDGRAPLNPQSSVEVKEAA
jgi:hypothetical protein